MARDDPFAADYDPTKAVAESDDEEKQQNALDDEDISILKSYGKGPYGRDITDREREIAALQTEINTLIGVQEQDLGLGPPSTWNLPADAMLVQNHGLLVARCTKIMEPTEQELELAKAATAPGQRPKPLKNKYIIEIENVGRFIVDLHQKVAPDDIEEGMRVGIHPVNMSIRLPLPPRIDPTVTTMEVEDKPDVTYEDIGGCKEQLQQLREVLETPLLHPERFDALGITPPKGVLLYGPPGTGKTLTARAVANRTDASFIRVVGSELVQRYIGEGARMVRELFQLARSKKAAIIFFDEADSFATKRTDSDDGADNEVNRTMMELLNQLDGFEARGNIRVIFATNRPDTLDTALMRPGRVDRRIEFGLPDDEGRAHIFRIHCGSLNVEKGVRYDLLSRLAGQATTGADIKSICVEAGMFALRERRKIVSEADLIKAIERIKSFSKFSAVPKYSHFN